MILFVRADNNDSTQTIKTVLIAKRESEAQSALKLLVQTADTEPVFLKQCIPAVVDTMLAIANSKDFEEGFFHFLF